MKNTYNPSIYYKEVHRNNPRTSRMIQTHTKTKGINIYSFLFGILGFVISYYYGQYWVLGDQGSYIRFYENVRQFNLHEGLKFYRSVLGASEPVYYYLVYIVSPHIDKLIFFSFVNFLLAYFTARSILNLGTKKWVLLLFIFNFYLVVLYTGAERLKVAATFIVLALNIKNYKIRFIFLVGAVLSHFQVALLIPAIFSDKIADGVKKGMKLLFTKKILSYLAILLIFAVLFILFKEAILRKITGRIDKYMGWENLIKPILLYIVTTLLYKKEKIRVLISFLPVILLAYYVGDFRITILAYFISTFYLLKINRGVNLGIIIPALYFSHRGIIFLESIIINGYGKFN